MLFGKFDFTEFGTAAYGSLASPLTAGAAASTADFGAQEYASITMDFGDFQFLSLGTTVQCDSRELCVAAGKALGKTTANVATNQFDDAGKCIKKANGDVVYAVHVEKGPDTPNGEVLFAKCGSAA